MQRTTADLILTTVKGDSSHLMQRVERLYFRKGMSIADVTYGGGVFWRKIDTTLYDFRPSDLIPQFPEVAKLDCRKLPYQDAGLDIVVFDPPFIGRGSTFADYDEKYKISTFNLSPEEIYLLYCAGMKEAKRVLRSGGLLMVKCKDSLASGRQTRISIALWNYATSRLGLIDQDRFILVRTPLSALVSQLNQVQRQAFASEAYLWVFKKR